MEKIVKQALLQLTTFVAIGALSFASLGSEVRTYSDDVIGYEIAVPAGVFEYETVDDQTSKLTLRSDSEDVVLEVYGGQNSDGMSLPEFEDFLSQSDRIAEVTYRRSGRTWLVLSGYYQRDNAEAGELVFYAKFVFSSDLSRFAGFEISYPRTAKRKLDPIVEAIEDNFRGPR